MSLITRIEQALTKSYIHTQQHTGPISEAEFALTWESRPQDLVLGDDVVVLVNGWLLVGMLREHHTSKCDVSIDFSRYTWHDSSVRQLKAVYAFINREHPAQKNSRPHVCSCGSPALCLFSTIECTKLGCQNWKK